MAQPTSSPTGTDDPIVITRDLELDVPSDELWQLVADGERWAEWLTDAADVVVEPARQGTVVDEDGVERRVSIHSVVPGAQRSLRVVAVRSTGRVVDGRAGGCTLAPQQGDAGERSRLSVIETYASTGPVRHGVCARIRRPPGICA